MGEEQTRIICQHNSLIDVMNQVLGEGDGAPKGTGDDVQNMAAGAASLEGAISQINAGLKF